MDDQTSKENPSKDFNKLDLSQLQGFSFGTQWTQDKSASSRGGDSHRDDEGGDRPRRQGGPGGDRRDRRSFRKPAATPGDAPAPATNAPAENQPPRQDDRPARREFSGDRDQRGPGPRRDFGGAGAGARGPRRDGPGGRPGQGGYDRGPRREGGYEQREPIQHGPYISPYYNVIFYPEDTGFAALVKAIRTSCRTYELFEIARVIIGKNDRFVATIQRKQPASAGNAGQSADSQSAAPGAATAPAKLPQLAISMPDGLPFDNEEAAIAHVLSKHLGTFFDSAEVEVEAPKGNYQVINKCGITGELLGPPNYHLYNQIVQQHHATRVTRMGFESFRSRIETIRDPEVVKQWLEKMKKTTRYTWKFTPPAEGATAVSFDSLEDARSYLLTNSRDKVVRTVETARMHGKLLENLPQGEMHRAIEGTLDRQRRFPLDTANALRGRLRREGFTIFKKGSKGISYVCAVKRKFRIPGQTFADSIGGLIAFIEANPMVKASELPAKFLNIVPLEMPATAPAPIEQAPATETPAATAPSAEPQPTDAVATPESTTPPIAPSTTGSVAPFVAAATKLSAVDQSRLHRLTGDLRWLVSEGYVTEFIDGRLFAPPAMTEARKQEVEKDEHDPENFPETPAAPVPETASAPEKTEESAAPSEVAVETEAAPASEQPSAETTENADDTKVS